MKKLIALLLAAVLLLTGCAGKVIPGEDLMKGVKPSHQGGLVKVEKYDNQLYDGPAWDNTLIAEFGLRLFRETMTEGENTLVSPMSVMSALAMTANGAEGNTRTQMEEVLGQSVDALNNWYQYGTVYEDAIFHQANGIWFKDDPNLVVEESFLQKNADYFGAGIYQAPFDNTTLKEINRFVEENTDGMIKDILSEIPESALMYLVNALSFEAEWEETYDRAHDAIFTTEEGEKQAAELMYSEESIYLEDSLATGFLKYYKNDRYAFLAMLPNEGVTVEEYVRSLDGASLRGLITNLQKTPVSAAIPKFQTEYDVDMVEVLKTMGMTDAFDPNTADFSRMGTSSTGNIYLSQVIHKTFINVAEKGTKAGAATAVAMTEGAAEVKREIVTLDRPFFYMILDMQSNTPIFMGTLMRMA